MSSTKKTVQSKDDRLKINIVFGVRDQRRYKDVIEYFNNIDIGYRNTEAKELLQLALKIKMGNVKPETVDEIHYGGIEPLHELTKPLTEKEAINPKLINTINKWSK